MLTSDFPAMARYNRWMNERLYACCEKLSDAERKRDRGAFFRSIHGTLNHLLLGDRLWLSRFLSREFRFKTLADELYADFAELAREREKTDAEILDWVETLDEKRLAAPLEFHSVVRNRDHRFPMGFLAQNFFNHQTHHRGQVTTLLMQAGVDPGVTDLLWLPGMEEPA
ncbi:MAG: damage-inducible protein DinB [Betaproteobacteria bacterium]|nr:MAG: damage-inducible protein DinB [Betaproteobacteria bacterium]